MKANFNKVQFVVYLLLIGGVMIERTSGDVLPLEYSADVIVVGSGASGHSAVFGVLRERPNATIIILESSNSIGGTTYRSGGAMWIPNNSDLVGKYNLTDPKTDALKYMARVSFPDLYNSSHTTLGLPLRKYELLEAYYDNGADMVDWYRDEGIFPWNIWVQHYYEFCNDPLGLEGSPSPDYHPEYIENIPKHARVVVPDQFGSGGVVQPPHYGAPMIGHGRFLIEWFNYALVTRYSSNVQYHYNTRAYDIDVTTNPGGFLRVHGVHAETTLATGVKVPVYYAAHHGVVFTTGGYSRNRSRVEEYQGHNKLNGSGCAVPTAQGAFVDIALKYNLTLEDMDQSWFVENVYEQYKLDSTGSATDLNYFNYLNYFTAGDSMVYVNLDGLRIVNEKLTYNERTKVHFTDSRSLFIISVFDQHTLEYFIGFGGQVSPLPNNIIGPANDLDELTQMLVQRTQTAIPGYNLAANFSAALNWTLERFAGFARTGVDLDFHRGETEVDLYWHTMCLYFGHCINAPSLGIYDCISANHNETGHPYPNPTLRPLKAPYYAVIVSSGMQDTKGGPRIDKFGRILDSNDNHVRHLYGAGNCVSPVSGEGYWGPGSTIGSGTVFGHIAGRYIGSNM